ncbi:MAG: hypothetical protein ACT4QC_18745 [Planctomycetaceae bacterium]
MGLGALATGATYLQGRHPPAYEVVPSLMFIMLLGFLGAAYSRIMSRIAEVAEANAGIEHSGTEKPADSIRAGDQPT